MKVLIALMTLVFASVVYAEETTPPNPAGMEAPAVETTKPEAKHAKHAKHEKGGKKMKKAGKKSEKMEEHN